MLVLFGAGLAVCDLAEKQVPPRLADLGVSAGNMEGKEVRFGIGDSVLTTVVTSNGATGSYNSMLDSYQPVGLMVPLVNMLLGEVVFGGLGTGLYSIVLIALVGVFMGGLMVGRTPEYLGKTITAAEAKLIALYTLLTPLVVLPLTGWTAISAVGRTGLATNTGPHGFTEILFAYASCMANNGQSMAGLNANSLFYNLSTSAAMAAGRFGLAAFALALAGRFARQTRRPNDDRLAALRHADVRRVGAGHRSARRRTLLPAGFGARPSFRSDAAVVIPRTASGAINRSFNATAIAPN